MSDTPERHPAARASAARDNVGHVEIYRPGALARVRALIPEASLAAIDHTLGFSWLDFEHDHWLMDATLEVLGVEDAVACWRSSIGELVRKPLLHSFVEGGLRLFGAQPGKLLKLLPKGWSLAYRDFCVPRFQEVEERCVEIHFEEIAPQAFASPGYLHCWHGICLGLFDLEKPADPDVRFEIDQAGARAFARFRWS